MEEKNTTSATIKTSSLYSGISLIVVILGIALCFFIALNINNFETQGTGIILLIVELISTFVIWFIVNTAKEIIQLLEDIKNK